MPRTARRPEERLGASRAERNERAISNEVSQQREGVINRQPHVRHDDPARVEPDQRVSRMAGPHAEQRVPRVVVFDMEPNLLPRHARSPQRWVLAPNTSGRILNFFPGECIRAWRQNDPTSSIIRNAQLMEDATNALARIVVRMHRELRWKARFPQYITYNDAASQRGVIFDWESLLMQLARSVELTREAIWRRAGRTDPVPAFGSHVIEKLSRDQSLPPYVRQLMTDTHGWGVYRNGLAHEAAVPFREGGLFVVRDDATAGMRLAVPTPATVRDAVTPALTGDGVRYAHDALFAVLRVHLWAAGAQYVV